MKIGIAIFFAIFFLGFSFAATPIVSNVSISSTNGTNLTSENLTVYWNVSDADGDPIYNITDWRLNNGSIAVLNMPFEGGSNSTFTRDYSNNSNNGTVNNAVWNSTGGHDGFGAYQFDGDGDYINATVPPIGLGNYTICAWINTSASNAMIVSNGDAETGDYQLRVSSSKIALYGFYDGGMYVIGSATPVNDSQWHFACGQFNPAGAAGIYLDGSYDGGAGFAPENPAAGSTNLFIGDDPGTFPSFNGTIDQVTIWNRILSEAELDLIYQNQSNILAPQETQIGDFWQACMTPNDGTSDGTTECSNILKISSPPIVQNVSLSSSLGMNTTAENLSVSFDSVDLDGHPVYNVTDWRLNGSSITIINMPFEGGSNSVLTRDYSSYGNNATVNGPIWNQTGGYDGFGAYEFDGVSSYLITGITDNSFVTRPFTVAAWIKTNSTAPGTVVRSEIGIPDTGMVQSWTTLDSAALNKITFGAVTNNSIWEYAISTTSVNDNVWHYVVGSYTGSSFQIYVDGVLENTTSTTGVPLEPVGTGWYIGRYPLTNAELFKGSIDEVKVYNRLLSAEQILAIYNNRTDRVVSQETQIDDVWSVCLTPNDGIQDGSEVCSNTITIGPSISSPPSASTSSSGSSTPRLSVSLDMSCNDNTIMTNAGSVSVNVVDENAGSSIYSGTTDSDGEAMFNSCGRTVRVYANRDGYRSADERFVLDSCTCLESEVSPVVTPPEPTPQPTQNTSPPVNNTQNPAPEVNNTIPEPASQPTPAAPDLNSSTNSIVNSTSPTPSTNLEPTPESPAADNGMGFAIWIVIILVVIGGVAYYYMQRRN
ncbi:MAG: LamG domain-containing protein [Candidatus Bilamarchaeum sp.]